MKIMYFVVTIYDVVTGVIFMSEFIEDFSIFENFLKKNGNLQRVPVYLMRLALLASCISITFVSESLATILDVGGGFCAAFLSYIIPVNFCLMFFSDFVLHDFR
jgi:hypothetical protein